MTGALTHIAPESYDLAVSAAVDAFARVVAVAGLLVGAGGLVLAILDYRRRRARVVVTLRLGGHIGPPQAYTYASVRVTPIGRPVTVEGVSLLWADTRQMPSQFGTSGLRPEDLGMGPNPPEILLAIYGVTDDVLTPNWSPIPLADGEGRDFPLGRITVSDDWTEERMNPATWAKVRASVRIVGMKEPILSDIQPARLHPPDLRDIVVATSPQPPEA